MKCEICIHKDVCKFRPPKTYPQFLIQVITEKCKYYMARGSVK